MPSHHFMHAFSRPLSLAPGTLSLLMILQIEIDHGRAIHTYSFTHPIHCHRMCFVFGSIHWRLLKVAGYSWQLQLHWLVCSEALWYDWWSCLGVSGVCRVFLSFAIPFKFHLSIQFCSLWCLWRKLKTTMVHLFVCLFNPSSMSLMSCQYVIGSDQTEIMQINPPSLSITVQCRVLDAFIFIKSWSQS